MTDVTPEIVPVWEAESVPPPTPDQRLEAAGPAPVRRLVGDASLAIPSREEIEAEKAAAHDAGVVEGRALGFEDAVRRSNELHATLMQSVQHVQDQVAAERRELLSGITELALEIATEMMGRTPHDDGAALVQRLRQMAVESPGAFTRVAVSTLDEPLVAESLSSMGIAVSTAADLSPGEARIDGDWASAQLTVQSMAEQFRATFARATDDLAPPRGGAA